MKKGLFTKGLAGILTAVLITGILSGVGSNPVKVQAAADAPEVRNINLSIQQEDGSYIIAGVNDPTLASEDWNISSAWEGSKVYFGSYGGSPILFRVLDADTTKYNDAHTMLLDCDMLLEKVMFYPKNYWNDWDESSLKEWMNSDAQTGFTDSDGVEIPGMLHTFTGVEKDAIALSTKESEAGTDGYGWPLYLDWCPLSNDKVFALDAKEVTYPPYGYSSTNSPAENRMKTGAEKVIYWLRSDDREDVDHYCVGVVSDWNGRLSHICVANNVTWASPALNLSLSSVLFASASGTDKSSDLAEVGTDGVSENIWELTLLDTGKTVGITSGKCVTGRGNTITVPYTYTGTDISQISVMITDKAYDSVDAVVLYYGKLNTKDTFSSDSGSGKGTFILPVGLPDTAKIYILAEDVNSDNYVDYASVPVLIENIEQAASGSNAAFVWLGVLIVCFLAGVLVVIIRKKKKDAEKS